MQNTDFVVVASLTPMRPWPFRTWIAEVTGPASPLAGLTATGRTPTAARRDLAATVAVALVDDRVQALPEGVRVEVVTWQSTTYDVPLPFTA
jgi:hypothetical protein